MKFSLTILAAIAAITPVSAFTNGALVPSYICNPQNDGLPKKFSDVLAKTQKKVTTVGFDANAGDNVNAKNQNGANPPNSAYILASFHNSPNRVTSLQQSITVTAKNNQIVAGQANQLTLSSGGNNVVLGGVLIYGVDGSGTRQGSFTDAGTTFIPFPGCGTNPQGQNVGVIQQNGISATGTYSQLSYNAPAGATGNITLAGLFVTAKGFGTFSKSFNVGGAAGGATGGAGGKGKGGGKTGGTGATTASTSVAAKGNTAASATSAAAGGKATAPATGGAAGGAGGVRGGKRRPNKGVAKSNCHKKRNVEQLV